MIYRTQENIMQNWPKEWDTPMVSIRTQTYNHEQYIAQALDSFLQQETNFPFEIVVHDDASTDKTADIIREYEAKYPKIIKPIYETENQYSKKDGSLRKIMDNACKGKYIAYCEGDDYWCDPHKLQMQYEAMEAHPECSLCTHIVQCVSEQGNPVERFHPPHGLFNTNIIQQDELAQAIIANFRYPFQTSSYFILNDLLRKNESFFDIPGNGDEKIMRLCLNNGKTYFISKTMSCYRLQSIGSWSSKMRYSKEMRMTNLYNNIKLNQEFDKYSNYRFHKFVEIAIRKNHISIAAANGQLKELFSPENREITKKMYPSSVWMKFYICSKMPTFIVKMIFFLRSKLKGEFKSPSKFV